MSCPEHQEKRRRLLELLDARRLDAVVLRRPGNVAWYSGGGRSHVLATPEVGVADLVVTRDGDQVVTTANEAARLRDEELAGLAASFRVLAWEEDRVGALPGGPRVGADAPLPGAEDVSGALEAARRRLTAAEADRYRALGRDAAEALTAACQALRPADTELAGAARTAAALLERGIDPVVLLVAGDRRLPEHRHPLPTGAELGRLAMLVACGRRHGLIASLTRFVAFGLPAGLRDAHQRLLRVDVAFNLATVPGRTVGEAFRAGLAAYLAEGFGPDEWRRHHQGGPTGYEARDYLATAAATARIEEGQAFAWNPTVPSLKSEDTVLARAGRPEVLTVDPAWPAAEVAGLRRPLILEA
jgi:Xaa-Pro aminopeptidase